ncbi:MAG: hypothetical protein SRB2_01361 [Desulfobacteraceae bacterium Eth-SRB2]|nr:MAG: hypothetical protein SRB2_01361 [Desulfobacteraceae bacterium Eth-SRB2]
MGNLDTSVKRGVETGGRSSTSVEIGDILLFISLKRWTKHRSNIMNKLNLHEVRRR